MENCEISVEFGKWLLNRKSQPRFKFVESNEQVFKLFIEEKKRKEEN